MPPPERFEATQPVPPEVEAKKLPEDGETDHAAARYSLMSLNKRHPVKNFLGNLE